MQTVDHNAIIEHEKATPSFTDIRDGQGRLLCRYDARLQLLEIKRRHEGVVVIDLKEFTGDGKQGMHHAID